MNNIFHDSNKDNIENKEIINNNINNHYNNNNISHKKNHSYNKVIKINKSTYNNNNNYNYDYNNYNNKKKGSEKSINVNDYRNYKEYNLNYDTNLPYDNKYIYKSNNNSNHNSFNKYIKINDGEIQLFHKKNKPYLMHGNNSHDKEKVKSRQRHKQNYLNKEYNTTNKIINHFMLSNANKNNNKMNSCINDNNPIRINYIRDYENKKNENNYGITPRNDNNNNLYENNKAKKIQQKINNMKKKIGFEGNNDEFIEYLRIIKIKADITYLVENMFNSGGNSDEETTKMCFKKLENLIENKNNEEKNLLDIYQYLVEQLLKTNNINKNDFLE